MSAPTDFVRLQKHLEIDATSRLVLICISFFTNYRTGECFPSMGTLSQETGLHSCTVRRHVHELEKLGVIKLTARENATSIITLVGYKEWVDGTPQLKSKGTSVALEGTSTALEGGTSTGLEGYSRSASGVLAERSLPPSAALAEIDNINIINNSYKKKLEDITFCDEEETRVWIDNDQIKLCDQLNATWLKEFDGLQDDLNLALIQIAPYVNKLNRVHSLEKQVSSQLAKITLSRKERLRNYQQIAKTKPVNGKPNFNGSKQIDPKDDAITQHAKEFFARMERGEFK